MQDTVGKYQLAERIASGGMADVYRAFMNGPGGFRKTVAIKQIRKHLSEEPEFVDMFMNEAMLAARLDHPNIVQVFEFNRDRNQYYLVMEYISGLDLKSAQECITGAWNPLLVLFLASKILAGLQYAHELRDSSGRPLQVIHRDISPHNILLSVNGEVKLADFGIARLRDAVSHTHANMVRGKLPYLSPEQARGDLIDARSDLFSLGLVMWELFTGFRRYRDVQYKGMAEVMAGDFEPPGSYLPDFDPRIDDLMYRFLAPNPANRFFSAADARQEIERLFPWDATSTVAQLIHAHVQKTASIDEEATILLARDVSTGTWGFDDRNQERPTTLMDPDFTATRLDFHQRPEPEFPTAEPCPKAPVPAAGPKTPVPAGTKTKPGRMVLRTSLFILLAITGMGMGFAGVRAFDQTHAKKTGAPETQSWTAQIPSNQSPRKRIRMIGGQFGTFPPLPASAMEQGSIQTDPGNTGSFTKTTPPSRAKNPTDTLDQPAGKPDRKTGSSSMQHPEPLRTVPVVKPSSTTEIANPPENPAEQFVESGAEPAPPPSRTTSQNPAPQEQDIERKEELKVIAEWE